MYTGDVFGATSGGISGDAVYLDNLDLVLTIDGESLLGAHRTLLQAHVQSNRGSSLSARVGDFQGVSNIEADRSWRLYELWLEHEAVPGRLSLLAGVYDVNSEFDVVPVAGGFVGSSFGFGAEYAASGRNGPSTFGATSWGVRVKTRPVPFSYVSVALTDGDPVGIDRSGLALGGDEGALLSFEAGYRRMATGEVDDPRQLPGAVGTGGRRIGRGRTSERLRTKLAVGAWAYTRSYDARDGTGEGPSWGVYLLGQRRLHDGGDDRGITLFGRVGTASDRVNRIGAYAGGGLVATGLIPSRGADALGVGIAHARNGTPFLDARRAVGLPRTRAETALEWFYAIELGESLRLQPDVQLLLHPDMDPGRDRALVIGLRGIVSLSVP